jgi:hypothetical protein
MPSDAATSTTPWARRWGGLLAAISVIGTILAVLSVFLLTALVVALARDFGGEESTGWFWLVAIGFAAAGVAGLVLTSRVPSVAYGLRLAALVPLFLLGFVTPWLLAPAVVVAAADVSLMISHWGWSSSSARRALVGVLVAAALAILFVPLDRELSCENPGDPPDTCDVTYRDVLGWGYYEDDNRDLAGWILVALLGGLLVALPVARDERDALV